MLGSLLGYSRTNSQCNFKIPEGNGMCHFLFIVMP